MPKTFLTAEWRKLIMAQYAIDPAILTPYLPPGVQLDLYHHTCYVSLVGFLFDRVRLKGLAIPFHTRFEEVNLRFYVVRPTPDNPRRGVVFVREFVPLPAITLVANTIYEEPYATLPTRYSITSTPAALNVQYSWKHSHRWHELAVEADPDARPIPPGSVEEFITEHYWGYTKRRDHTTSAYQVEHPRWHTYPIRSHRIDVDFAALYGPAFAPLNHQQPDNILLAEGSAVRILSATGERLT